MKRSVAALPLAMPLAANKNPLSDIGGAEHK